MLRGYKEEVLMSSPGIPAQACMCVTRHEEPHSGPKFRVTPTIFQQHHLVSRLRPHKDQLETMHKTVTATKPVEQRSPFLSLPPEVRLIIYSFALQDTISAIEATSFRPTSLNMERHLPIVGALALLFTSREIRAESSDAMRIPGDVFAGSLLALNSYVTQVKRDAVVHGRSVVFDKGVWDDHLWRMKLMNSARLIILMVYSRSRVEM
jgi:hypothetical protein